MTNKTFYLTLEQLLIIHTDQIERYGGSHGLRDLGLLESAVFRPESAFAGKDLYPTIFDKAAALSHSLILNHPFVDGNKRTAIASLLLFLEINRQKFSFSEEELIDFALWVEKEKPALAEIVDWLKDHSN